MLESPAVQQIRRDAGGSECMAAGGIGESRLFWPPLDHLKDVEAAHGIAGEVVALVYAPKQWLFLFPGDTVALIQSSR
jgi:hypothetical protein